MSIFFFIPPVLFSFPVLFSPVVFSLLFFFVPQLPSVPLSTVEVERRMHMLEIPDEEGDGLVVRAKKKRKRKPKRTGRTKLTPLSSKEESMIIIIIN